MNDPADQLINLKEAIPALRNPLLAPLARPIERLLGITALNRVHAVTDESEHVGTDYLRDVLETLGVTYEVPGTDLPRIPQEGPVIVVSNHPFGGIDAVMLNEILARQRKDMKILANYLLMRVPKASPYLVPIDPFGGEQAARRNLRGLRDALIHLRNGGLLATFPSGTVSHFRWSKRRIVDPDWNPHIASLIRKTGATVLPVHFSGRNSLLFQLAGVLHPALRTVLLPRETVNKNGHVIKLRIGKPIPYSNLKGFESDEQMMRFLRLNTYVLRESETKTDQRLAGLQRHGRMKPVAEPADPASLVAEVERLPPEAKLFRQKNLETYVASASQIPGLLREIGRLREITFREVGEGTGEPLDLDRFDDEYEHLFLWNRDAGDIVGAYRLAKTDRVLEEKGKHGLYTSTLFKFKPDFLENLGPALELGRSFIVSKYQRQHNSLALLWRGIGHYVVRNREYRILFGPVSISEEYQKLSKTLLVQFMTDKLSHPVLSPFVKPSKRFHATNPLGLAQERVSESVRDIGDVSALISAIEKDGKGIPILLKQYLRLNALLLSFNVDKKFSNVLDGLMLFDLTTVNPRILGRYLGEGTEEYLRYHKEKASASVSE